MSGMRTAAFALCGFEKEKEARSTRSSAWKSGQEVELVEEKDFESVSSFLKPGCGK